MSLPPVIVWFRQDLRLADNPALDWAARQGAVIPVYILEEDVANPWPLGGAARWWLHYGLADLTENLAARGLKLILRHGRAVDIIPSLLKETGAKAVTWNRRYEPFGVATDAALADTLAASSVEVSIHNGALLFDPAAIRNQSGEAFKVYTPFARACFGMDPGACLSVPKKIEAAAVEIASDHLDDWHLLPTKPDWAVGFRTAWKVGEKAAEDQLRAFIKKGLSDYKQGRDRPDQSGTSRLSPALHFGHISPRQIWHAVQFMMAREPSLSSSAEVYLKEVLWREFAYHNLAHYPHMPDRALNKNFDAFPWGRNDKWLRTWQRGQTGYPIVDAGMRQLWQTGWMHNRVRMIVASFLVKDLLVPWQDGARWFMDTLVDADLASNAAGWQWTAGCGIDAAPYFRIFNPILQGKKFDPNGDYVRHYVPELKGVPTEYIHEPWHASPLELADAGVVLGKHYPHPMVDHAVARDRALEALASIKK